MSDSDALKPATRAIHSQYHQDAYGSPYTPVYNTTTFRFDATADLLDVVEGRVRGNLYTRWGTNPTITELEHALAGMEGAESALAFGSGMAAISATLLAHGRKGIVCVGDLYGGTQEFLVRQCQPLGIPVQFLLQAELEQLESCLPEPGCLVYCETPANPTLSILDLRDLADRAHRMGALLAVDNTFASPVNQRPLSLGADLVVHSATKYLGGHSDLTAGALMASQQAVNAVAEWRKNLGQIIAPEIAALLSRSLRTLPLRIRQHNSNALAVARAMAQNPPQPRQSPDGRFRRYGQHRGERGWPDRCSSGRQPATVPAGHQSGRAGKPGYPALHHQPSRPECGGAATAGHQ